MLLKRGQENRGAVILILLFLFSFIQLLPTGLGASAYGALTGNTQKGNNANSGFWGAQITTLTGATTNSAYQIVWTGNANRIYYLVSWVNTGSFDLNTGHISFSSAKPNGDTASAPNLIFEICSGTWDPNNYSCSGTITSLGSGVSGTINYNQYLAAGNRLAIRVTHLRNNSANFITTLSATSYRGDIRSPQVLHS